MLETLGQTNIGRLNLEESGTFRLFFDPERDLTESDWVNMKWRLSHEAAFGYIDMAGKMRFIFPDREEDLNFEEHNWDLAERSLKSHINRFDLNPEFYAFDEIKGNLASCILAFPRETKTIRNYYKELSSKLKNQFNYSNIYDLIGGQHPVRFAVDKRNFLSDLAILAPEEIIPSEDLEKFKQEQFNILKKRFKYREGRVYLALDAGKVRLIFPNSDLNIPSYFWEVTKNLSLSGVGMNKLSSSLIDTLIEGSFYLKILAAEEIRVTDKGLEVVMPKPKADFNAQVPALPEVRKF
ncbi:MAG: hypothetical protein Q7R49_01740 [Candidatus Daviesbacteria bacterium]|nr:hypothetical protein [Candidatus Daviesbacteria bacterium]